MDAFQQRSTAAQRSPLRSPKRLKVSPRTVKSAPRRTIRTGAVNAYTGAPLLGHLPVRVEGVEYRVKRMQPADLKSPQAPSLPPGLAALATGPPPQLVRNDEQNIFLRNVFKQNAARASAKRRNKPPAVSKITDLISSAPNSGTPTSRVKPPMRPPREPE